jgi:hemerythrin superfamily protein
MNEPTSVRKRTGPRSRRPYSPSSPQGAGAVDPFGASLVDLFPTDPRISMTATDTIAPSKARPEPTHALELLEADHEAVSELFAEYENTRSVPGRKALVAEICTALSVHAQIEEEIFYPELRSALKNRLRVPEAAVEHAGVKDMIAQIRGVEPDGARYDAKVKVLSDCVRHHVRQERNETFPKAMGSSLDMIDLGARLSARRDDLLARAG